MRHVERLKTVWLKMGKSCWCCCHVMRHQTRTFCTWQVCRWLGRHWPFGDGPSPDIEATLSTQGHFRSSAQASSFCWPWKCETQLHRPRTFKVSRKLNNNNKHDSTQKHTYTHIHTQRSVQVSLTISGCTAPTDFSWVSRNYFAPPFSTLLKELSLLIYLPTPWTEETTVDPCWTSRTIQGVSLFQPSPQKSEVDHPNWCRTVQERMKSILFAHRIKTTNSSVASLGTHGYTSLAHPCASHTQHHSAKSLGPLDLSSFALHPAAGTNRWRAQTAAWPGALAQLSGIFWKDEHKFSIQAAGRCAFKDVFMGANLRHSNLIRFMTHSQQQHKYQATRPLWALHGWTKLWQNSGETCGRNPSRWPRCQARQASRCLSRLSPSVPPLPMYVLNWEFTSMGLPQNGWFIRENPIKMDD